MGTSNATKSFVFLVTIVSPCTLAVATKKASSNRTAFHFASPLAATIRVERNYRPGRADGIDPRFDFVRLRGIAVAQFFNAGLEFRDRKAQTNRRAAGTVFSHALTAPCGSRPRSTGKAARWTI